MMGSVLNLQAKISKGDIDQDREEKVETIWEGVSLSKHLAKQGSS